jgi:hypothetical protein
MRRSFLSADDWIGCSGASWARPCLLHHLSDDQRLSESLGGVRAALGHEGKFIVVEMLLLRYLELLQGALRPLIYRFLRWMGEAGSPLLLARIALIDASENAIRTHRDPLR